MNWQEQELYLPEDEHCKLVHYSTYYTSTKIVDRIKSYLKQIHYKPKH
jgi:hypothetical protein